MNWAAASSGGMTLLDTVTLSGSSTTSATFSSTGYQRLFIFIKKIECSAEVGNRIRINGDTGNNYAYNYIEVASGTNGVDRSAGDNKMRVGYTANSGNDLYAAYTIIEIERPTDTDLHFINSRGYAGPSSGYTDRMTGVYNASAAVSTITFIPDSGTYSGGTVYIYGVK